MIYYLAFAKTLHTKSPDLGKWELLKGEDGFITFATIEEAKECGTSHVKENESFIEYYVLSIVG